MISLSDGMGSGRDGNSSAVVVFVAAAAAVAPGGGGGEQNGNHKIGLVFLKIGRKAREKLTNRRKMRKMEFEMGTSR